METITNEELARDVVFDKINGWPVVSDEYLSLRFDEETGLPVVPPGFYWRIGDHQKPTYRNSFTDLGPCVKLMMLYQTTDTVTQIKTKKTLFGGLKEVGREPVIRVETHVCVHAYEKFHKRTSWEGRDSIPAIAIDLRKHFNVSNVPSPAYSYSIPMTKEGILYLATELFSEFIKREKHRKEQEAERQKAQEEADKLRAVAQAFKDEFYGDYPPKSL